jgi:hypothetical protein
MIDDPYPENKNSCCKELIKPGFCSQQQPGFLLTR